MNIRTIDKAVITPLHKAHKRGTSSSQWQQAYQAVKHYRTKSIKRATVGNLLNALGALYILNLYYADEAFWMETPIKDRREYTVDSKVFTPFVCDASKISMSTEMSNSSANLPADPLPEECIYIEKVTEAAFRYIHDAFCKFDINIILKIKMSNEYKEYARLHLDAENLSAVEIATRLGKNYYSLIAQESKLLGSPIRRLSEKEIILNKNNNLYPTLTIQEFMDSDEGKKYTVDLANSLLKN